MSKSREERARSILQLCEYAARNLMPDMDDVDDHGIQDIHDAFECLTSKLRYLLPRSSAAWDKKFEMVLDSSHSMRVEVIQASDKEKRRAVMGKCMACGRKEKNCRYSIDLAGSLSPRLLIQSPKDLVEGYAKFVDDYDAASNERDVVRNAKRDKMLSDDDNGCFLVGETCLRKAQLRYLLNTLLLDTAYEAERIMESVAKSEPVYNGELYTITDERVNELIKQQDDIELAIADERRRVPRIAVDHEFWAVLDNARNAASGGDEGVFNSMVQSRANSRMEMYSSGRHSDVDEEQDNTSDDDFSESPDRDDSEEDDGVESGEDEWPKAGCKRKGRRTSVVIDDDDDEAADKGHNNKQQCLRQTRPSTMRQRQPSTGNPGCSKDAPSRPLEKEDAPASEGNEASCGRKKPISASGIAGIQRAAGTLPSRRNVLLSLMELQTRLERQDKHEDAVVCTQAILTLQEMMDRIESLSHTVGI